ncbi:hypothetical protein AAMO2058_001148200 [Amorphochlora amoebiformis]|uniref:Nucleolar protein 16 n=1 Tax=Amorphochlora amoebiformis TaxID=1561963 RepID=A0A7S0DU66_9EUKA|mmetsp:Transcript_6857/g.10628  ORF Transcript_6857/g.10628 Transcript_6857/m.10628 type:complete len:151 (+) Transcript_6857:27-479(+)
MGKKAARRKSTGKQTKSQTRKRKRQLAGPSLQFGHVAVKNHWNRKDTLRQNYQRLGLAFTVKEAVKAAEKKEEKAGIITDELTKIQNLPKPAKYVPKSMDLDEQRRLLRLMRKHGEDYKKMARDIKINVYQKTAAQLKNRIELLRSLQTA